MPAAFVAIEDRRFYEHTGFDPRGIARAVVGRLERRPHRAGASTITQQLARNLFLTQDRTLERKATELVYAVQLERSYTKKQILGLYLSRVYFGAGAYGLEAAAQRYFNKPAAKLTHQGSRHAGRRPEVAHRYNPVDNRERCRAPRNLVLDAMARDRSHHRRPSATRPLARSRGSGRPRANRRAQYFVDWVDGQVRRMVPKPTHDLVVETTLDQADGGRRPGAMRRGPSWRRAQGPGRRAGGPRRHRRRWAACAPWSAAPTTRRALQPRGRARGARRARPGSPSST